MNKRKKPQDSVCKTLDTAILPCVAGKLSNLNWIKKDNLWYMFRFFLKASLEIFVKENELRHMKAM